MKKAIIIIILLSLSVMTSYNTAAKTVILDHRPGTDGNTQPPIYAEIYFSGGTINTVLAGQDTIYQITNFTNNGESNNMLANSTANQLVVEIAGVYEVTMTTSARSQLNNDYEWGIYGAGGLNYYDECHVHRTTSTGGALGSATIDCFISLNVGDTIEVWVMRTDGLAVSKTLTTEHINLNALRIG